MSDTHARSRASASAGLTSAEVYAVDAVRQVTEHEGRELVTRDELCRVLLLPTGVLVAAGVAVLQLLG